MTQAAVAAQPAANGSAAGTAAAAAVKQEASPAPSDAKATAAAAAASGGAGDAARRSGSPSVAAAGGDGSARATPEAAAAAGAAGTADAAPSKEDEEQRKLEDEILAEGQAIAGVRALLAKAFSRPAEEPAVAIGHWGFLLREAEWLANDMAQERLWKQAAAVAIAYEVARMRGKFKLKPPPEGQRRYHDEIAALRAAAAKEAGGEKAGGRRSASKAATSDASAAAALKLDPADDPIWRDMEELSKELELPATPPSDDLGKVLALTWQHDAEFQEALEAQLMRSDVERMMKEEVAAREYRFEYEAALASHHMAVQEQNRRAMRLDADMADAEGLLPMDEDEAEDEVGGKKSKARKRARSGYLLDDLASVGAAPDETDSVPKGGPKGPGRQFIEDTYLQRKRRRERYKDVDVDYDVGMETAGRYGTRGNRQMATRAGASRAQDPNKRKQQLGQEAYVGGGGGGQGAMARHGTVRPTHPQTAVPGPVIWSKAEDDLLLAITHEFGVNWTMVSEVLSLSLSMQGIFRPPHLCKQRFRQITTPLLQQQAQQAAPPGTEVPPVDYSEDKALMALYMAMSKQQARELIVMSLPVHDDVMMRMLEALVQVGATAKQRRQLEEKRNEVRKIAEPHPSHGTVHQLVMAKTGNKHLTPMELAVQVDVAYAQQAKQHQMLAQQAQQAAQLQAQAAVPPPPGQQAAQAAAAAAAAAPPLGGAPGSQQGQQAQQQAQQQAGAPSPAVQGMPAAGGAPGVAAGTPAGAPGLPTQQLQAQQQQGVPSSATPPLPTGLPGQPGSAGTPGAAGLPPVGQGAPSPGAVGHAPAPRPQQQQITLQQLNHILDTGKLPNGQPLEPSMRKAIEDKKNTYLAQMAAMQQRQMMMQQQQAGGGTPGGAPGQGPSAAQAAMQAAQQAAAVQAGMRPAMPMGGAPMFRPGLPQGGMPGMQAGMPPGAGMAGQPMGMQPALLQQQMMGAPGMGMQPMQPGMQQMSAAAAAQQQAIMQQFAMQQQAQMAAAAQAQPGAQPPGA